ncbi:hypothetical protein QLQ15_09285 [Lysobacter sp. LF1]|uniref:DUF1624 domain-containing protein n=1 Tax=Lysobacter stagni TaxID=3045172 RepID=A0ABT6XGC9_9GAMM|nr:hypothetical protein [Lysobacter sp. LF1]MDI9239101.1 hypothetical protein [Lysobacter sp. LF1]
MDAHDDSMPNGLLQRLCFLHRSVSTLMDDPLGEQESTANYYLTVHCLMLLLFLFGIVDKHLFDLRGFLHDVWPVKSQNFRNPLSLGPILSMGLGVPIFLFWRKLGKTGGSTRHKGRPQRGYMSATFFSALGVNSLLLFVAAKLGLPEVSLVLGALNFAWWARWSTGVYRRQVLCAAAGRC